MLRTSVRPWFVFLVMAVTSCEKQSGEAVVLAKEHIDAALPIAERSKVESEPGPNAEVRPTARDAIRALYNTNNGL
jgi:hypothetical protein